MRWTLQVVFLATSVGLSFPGCVAPPARVVAAQVSTGDEPEIDPQALLDQIVKAQNHERAEADLLPLAINKRLCIAAQRQADDMAERNKMDHTGSDGSSSVDRIKDAGYNYKRCGENIAWGQKSVPEVVDVWMKSPPHKKNILGSFTQVGAARAFSKEGTPYWCVVFGTPLRD